MIIDILSTARDTITTEEQAGAIRHEHAAAFLNAEDELLQTGCFYPKLPIIAQIHDVHLSTRGSESAENCSKAYKSSGYLGAGVVLFWCIQHRECIGFTVLQKAESCQVIYDMLSTRMQKLPKIFVYDNACNLFEVSDNADNSTAITEIRPYFMTL